MLELATASDYEALNRLSRQVHALHVSWRPDIYEMAGELYPLERILESAKARELYVAKLNGVTVGYVLVKIKRYEMTGHVRRKVMVLDEICVDEAFRNHGIGSSMVEETIALGRAFGCTDMQLGVYPQNDEAVAFYQKCGFTIRSIDMQRKI